MEGLELLKEISNETENVLRPYVLLDLRNSHSLVGEMNKVSSLLSKLNNSSLSKESLNECVKVIDQSCHFHNSKFGFIDDFISIESFSNEGISSQGIISGVRAGMVKMSNSILTSVKEGIKVVDKLTGVTKGRLERSFVKFEQAVAELNEHEAMGASVSSMPLTDRRFIGQYPFKTKFLNRDAEEMAYRQTQLCNWMTDVLNIVIKINTNCLKAISGLDKSHTALDENYEELSKLVRIRFGTIDAPLMGGVFFELEDTDNFDERLVNKVPYLVKVDNTNNMGRAEPLMGYGSVPLMKQTTSVIGGLYQQAIIMYKAYDKNISVIKTQFKELEKHNKIMEKYDPSNEETQFIASYTLLSISLIRMLTEISLEVHETTRLSLEFLSFYVSEATYS